jgi:hypothetical protein
MKTIREMMDQLDEISRRDVLKGAGAAAAGAAGYRIHKDVSQDQYVNPLFHRIVGRLSEYLTSPIYKNIDKEKYNDVIKWSNVIKSQLLNPLMHRPMVDALYKEYQLGQTEAKQNISRSSTEEMLKEFNNQYAIAQQALDLGKDNKGFDRQKYEKSFSEQKKENTLDEASPDALSKIDELYKS